MLEVVFWLAAALIVYTHVGYPLLLLALSRLKPPQRFPAAPAPSVSVIVAARNEEDVIARRLANLRALRYEGRLELIVVSDGSTDATAERAREAGADLVVKRAHAGKVRAQDAGVEQASGEIVAFTDANTTWAPDALTELVRPFADRTVGYACGSVQFVRADGTNEEGTYWKYESAVRALESRLGGITAGNGAIYATRRDAYVVVDPRMGHDLSFPFNLVKRGWRAVNVASARAEEKMVPTVEGEFRRKRRMMSHTWPILVRGGMLSVRYPPLYALELLSHRVLRYLTPFLHLIAFGANIALLGDGAVYAVTLGLQVALLVAAALGAVSRFRPFKIAEYYVLVTLSSAAGLVDWIMSGTPAGWTRAEGTR